MMKSFRNLILSLFLAAGAAGLAACEGERGPVGEAGPTGTAGAAGPKGAAGDPGKSSDDIPSAYEFLKNWGKADGMAACNDDFFKKTEAFPGPAALAKSAKTVTTQRLPIPVAGETTVTLQVDIGDPDAAGNAGKGKCSDKVFAGTAGSAANAFVFTPTSLSEKITETKSGTTAVLGNPTLTEINRWFWGGMIAVNLNADAAAAEGVDRLAVRCDGRKRPADVGTDGKTIMGEYRLAQVQESENILEKDSGGTNVIKDSHPTGPNATTNDYQLTNFTSQVCIRLASVPGTVKCFVKTIREERDSANDDKAVKVQMAHKTTTKEHIALYRGGKLMQVMPMPYSDGRLAGTAPAGASGSHPQNFPWTSGADVPYNLSPGKLCNLFDKGVIPCPDGEVPGDNGACAAPSP